MPNGSDCVIGGDVWPLPTACINVLWRGGRGILLGLRDGKASCFSFSCCPPTLLLVSWDYEQPFLSACSSAGYSLSASALIRNTGREGFAKGSPVEWGAYGLFILTCLLPASQTWNTLSWFYLVLYAPWEHDMNNLCVLRDYDKC